MPTTNRRTSRNRRRPFHEEAETQEQISQSVCAEHRLSLLDALPTRAVRQAIRELPFDMPADWYADLHGVDTPTALAYLQWLTARWRAREGLENEHLVVGPLIAKVRRRGGVKSAAFRAKPPHK